MKIYHQQELQKFLALEPNLFHPLSLNSVIETPLWECVAKKTRLPLPLNP